jgi:TRAP-type mannitol/chloroaromatic compound transport system permease large subunit
MRRGAPVKDLERTVVAKSLQTLSRQLSSRLVQRKLAQTLLVVGALIGAGVNAALVSDVGITAIHAYRRRRLRQTALRRE